MELSNRLEEDVYYQSLVAQLFPKPLEPCHVAQKAQIEHLMGHLMYIQKSITFLEETCKGVRKWNPRRVLNEIRTATIYLSMVRKSIISLQQDAFARTPRSTKECFLHDLEKVTTTLFPYPVSLQGGDIYIHLINHMIGPIYNTYLVGIFVDTWNDIVDLAAHWNVSTEMLWPKKKI